MREYESNTMMKTRYKKIYASQHCITVVFAHSQLPTDYKMYYERLSQ